MYTLIIHVYEIHGQLVLVQFTDQALEPSPHVALQEDQSPQCDQPPNLHPLKYMYEYCLETHAQPISSNTTKTEFAQKECNKNMFSIE